MSTSEAQPSRALVVGTVSFYMVSGIIMVTANKYVLVKSSIPIFFLFAQLSIAVVLLCVSHVFGIFVIPKFNTVTVKKLWRLIALNVTGLCFNNFTLQYVDASFYQVARGLVLPLTVIITYVAYKKLPTSLALAACGCVTAGFFIGVIFGGGASSVSSLGVMFGVLSSVTTACHAIVIKDSLKAVDGSTMALAWYSNALSAVVMLPISILCAEGSEILRTWTEVELLRRFLWGTAVTGLFGFLICIAGFMSIKVTSPVSHMVSSAARGVIQTIVGVRLFGDIITGGRGLSIGTIIMGSCLYVYAKSQEAAAPPPAYAPVAMDDLEEGRAAKPETAAAGGEAHERRD